MFIFSVWSLRLFGISGIIGSIIFICGDLLYNHLPGSSASPTIKMSTLSESRLLNAGTLGLVGCWFYTLAALHVYIAFRPAGELFASILFLAFAAVMISFGIAHTAYFSIAAGARAAADLAADGEAGGKLGNVFFQKRSGCSPSGSGCPNRSACAGWGAPISGRSAHPARCA
jgi:hypothetical protein